MPAQDSPLGREQGSYEVGYYYGGTPHNRVIEIWPTVPETGLVAEEVTETFTGEHEIVLDQASLRLGVELHAMIEDEMSVTPDEAIAAREGRRKLDNMIDRAYETGEPWAVGYGLALTFQSVDEVVYLYVMRTA